MSGIEVQFVELDARGDARGALFRVPVEMIRALGGVGDIHFGDVRPGAIRGTHAHRGNAELLLVRWKDQCQLAWDNGEGTLAEIRAFDLPGTVALLLSPGCAHAIRNTGSQIMEFISLPSISYDITDVQRRILLA